jgi:hypothetical protein
MWPWASATLQPKATCLPSSCLSSQLHRWAKLNCHKWAKITCQTQDDLVAGRNPFQLLRDVLAKLAQLAATAGAAVMFGLVQDDFTWKIFGKWFTS